MSNFIRQNEVNMANEPLKVQQPLLESSSEMDTVHSQYRTFSSHQNYRDEDKFSSRILSDEEFQLVELDQLVDLIN